MLAPALTVALIASRPLTNPFRPAKPRAAMTFCPWESTILLRLATITADGCSSTAAICVASAPGSSKSSPHTSLIHSPAAAPTDTVPVRHGAATLRCRCENAKLGVPSERFESLSRSVEGGMVRDNELEGRRTSAATPSAPCQRCTWRCCTPELPRKRGLSFPITHRRPWIRGSSCLRPGASAS